MKLKGKNHILKTGHYRMKTQLQQDAEKKEELQVRVAAELCLYFTAGRCMF